MLKVTTCFIPGISDSLWHFQKSSHNKLLIVFKAGIQMIMCYMSNKLKNNANRFDVANLLICKKSLCFLWLFKETKND